MQYLANAEKHQEPTEERKVEHAFYHGVVEFMFRMGLPGADVKAAAIIITTEGERWRGGRAPHMGNDPTNAQEWPKSPAAVREVEKGTQVASAW